MDNGDSDSEVEIRSIYHINDNTANDEELHQGINGESLDLKRSHDEVEPIADSKPELQLEVEAANREQQDLPFMEGFSSVVTLKLMVDGKRHGTLTNIFTIWNSMIGSSVLGVPWAIRHSGLVVGLIILVLVGRILYHTAFLIVETFENHEHEVQEGDVGALCSVLLGKAYKIISKISVVILILGTLIVYWILMTGSLYKIGNLIHDLITETEIIEESVITNCTGLINTNDTSQSYVQERMLFEDTTFIKLWNHKTVSFYLVVVIFPLVSIKSPLFFIKFNAFGTLSVIYILIFVTVKSVQWGLNFTSVEGKELYTPMIGSNVPVLTGLMTLGFTTHPTIITIVRSNKNIVHNKRDLYIGYALGTLTYLYIGILFYVCYPMNKLCIEDNLLNNFEIHDQMAVIGRASILFQRTTNFVLLTYALRRTFMFYLFQSTYPSFIHVFLFNIFCFSFCFIAAIFQLRTGTVLRYAGSISGVAYMYALPCLISMSSKHKNGVLTRKTEVANISIILFGIVNFYLQFFVDEDIEFK